MAPHSGTIAECITELIITSRQTSSTDISVTEVDSSVQSEDSDVVTQSLAVKLRMYGHAGHAVLFVLVLLRPLECARIPLSNSYLQAVCVLEIVCSSDDLGRARVEVVVGVLGDDGAAPHKVVVAAEDEAGPGELPGRGLSMLQTRGRPRVQPLSTLVTAES